MIQTTCSFAEGKQQEQVVRVRSTRPDCHSLSLCKQVQDPRVVFLGNGRQSVEGWWCFSDGPGMSKHPGVSVPLR